MLLYVSIFHWPLTVVRWLVTGLQKHTLSTFTQADCKLMVIREGWVIRQFCCKYAAVAILFR